MLAARSDQLRGYQGKGAFDQLQQKGTGFGRWW